MLFCCVAFSYYKDGGSEGIRSATLRLLLVLNFILFLRSLFLTMSLSLAKNTFIMIKGKTGIQPFPASGSPTAGFLLPLKCERRQRVAAYSSSEFPPIKKDTQGVYIKGIQPFPASGSPAAGFSLSLKCERRQRVAAYSSSELPPIKKDTQGVHIKGIQPFPASGSPTAGFSLPLKCERRQQVAAYSSSELPPIKKDTQGVFFYWRKRGDSNP